MYAGWINGAIESILSYPLFSQRMFTQDQDQIIGQLTFLVGEVLKEGANRRLKILKDLKRPRSYSFKEPTTKGKRIEAFYHLIPVVPIYLLRSTTWHLLVGSLHCWVILKMG